MSYTVIKLYRTRLQFKKLYQDNQSRLHEYYKTILILIAVQYVVCIAI